MTWLQGQFCAPTVPTFNVDLTGAPDSTWISPPTVRVDTCCGINSPDRCVQFIVTLDTNASGIMMDIPETGSCGAKPPGALFYQVNCGPPVPIGTPVCLNGPGPHFITFCKPGNNDNCYQITSVPEPDASADVVSTDGCNAIMGTVGYQINTIHWGSIPSNPLWDSYLSCRDSCDTVTASATPGAPPFVDYQVCGLPLGDCDTILICDTIRVYFVSTLAVVIQPDSPTVCFGAGTTTIQAVVSGGAAPFAYQWFNGGVPVPGGTNATLAAGPGTFSVEVTDTLECSIARDTVVVTEFLMPILALAGADSAVCIGDNVFLSGAVQAASGGIWQGGAGVFIPNNTTLNAQYVPTAAEMAAGFVNLTLITTGNGTCPPDSDQVHFDIDPYPVPVIAGPASVCQYDGVFYSTPNVPGNTYLWAVTGGTISAGQGSSSIFVNWGAPGAGSVTVTETNPTGCDSTVSINVTILPKPFPVIAGPTALCQYDPGTYTVTGTPFNTYAWSVTGGSITSGQGTPSVNIAWGAAGTGTLTLTETTAAGCDTTVSINVTISPKPTPAIVGPISVCAGNSAGYAVNFNAGNTYLWAVSGGTITGGQGTNSISVNWGYSTSGTVAVTQTNPAGCDTTVSIAVTLNPTPVAAMIGPDTVCDYTAGVIYSTPPTAGATYVWTVVNGFLISGQGTPSISVNWSGTALGTVQVVVTSAVGCDTTVATSVAVIAKPATNLVGPTSVCAFNTNYAYSTSPSAGNTYLWAVTGGTIASGQGTPAINVNWGSSGVGTVSITQTDPFGCDSTTTVAVTINPTPQPVLAGPNSLCEYVSGIAYSVAPAPGHSFVWSVSGGVITSGQGSNAISVTWGSFGAGSVTLTQTSAAGCDTTVSLAVTINPKPDPVITGPTTLCQYVQAGYSVIPVPTHSYLWSVTGGSIVAGQGTSAVSIFWGAAGTGTLSITQTTPAGCDTTVSINVTISPRPTPSIVGPSTICAWNAGGYAVNFNAGNTYLWSVSGGTISGGQGTNSISVNWGAASSGTVTLTQTNLAGCDTTVSLPVTINPNPVAAVIGPDTVCDYTAGVIYSTPPTAGGTYVWTVVNGFLVSGQGTPSISVNWSGTALGTVQVVVTTALGCDTTVSASVAVVAKPATNLVGPTSVCAFNTNYAYSTSPSAGNTYVWAVTGGAIASGQGTPAINVNWGSSGVGTVSITQTDPFGCDSTTTVAVTINPTPQPVLAGPNSLCEYVSGIAYSVAPAPGHSFVWSVSGGVITSGQGSNAISVTWGSFGTGNVTLTQTSAQGCDTTISLSVTINPKPDPVITGPTSLCQYVQAGYSVIPVPTHSYLWSVTGGSIVAGQGTSAVSIFWGAAGTGTLTITQTTPAGCDTTVSINVAIAPRPTPSIVGSNSVCAWNPYNYSVNFNGGNTYAWVVAGGTIAAGQGTNSISVNWGAASAGSVTLTQTNAAGCDTTVSLPVTINPNPVAAVIGPDTVCDYTAGVIYSTPPTAGATYVWTVANGFLISGQGTPSITVNWSSSALGTVQLVVTSAAGCDTTVATSVAVVAKPATNLVGPPSVCEFRPNQVYSTSPSAGNTYLWVVSGGAIASGQGTPTISVSWGTSGAGSVSITQTDPLGCDSTTTLNVTINPTPQPVFTGAAVICAYSTGISYSVPPVVGHTYAWSVTGGIINSGQGTNAITVNWGAPGSGTVTLTQTSPQGCDTTLQLPVTINPRPIPAMTGPATVCALTNGVVYAIAPDPTSTFVWTVTGGAIQSGQGTNSILVNWAGPGIGTVNVVQTNIFGCDSSANLQVNILPQPTPVLSGAATVCAYQTGIAYSTPFVAGNTYAWTVNGGNILSGQGTNGIVVQWAAPGVGSVTLTETHPLGCDSTITLPVTISPAATPTITGTPVVCAFSPNDYFTDPDPLATNTWTVTGGTIQSGQGTDQITVVWSGPGSGSVTLFQSYPNGCDSSLTLNITIENAPIPNFTGPDSVCQFSQNTYTTPFVQGVTYVWTPQGGNVISGQGTSTVVVQWDITGNVQLELYAVSASGCDTLLILPVHVLEGPLAVINPNDVVMCRPDNLQLTGSYSINEVGYIWNLGNGVTTGEANPYTGYWVPGNYTIRLIAVGAFGCRDTTYSVVHVLPGPVAHFDVLPYTEFTADDDTAQFVNNTTGAQHYLWDFGDGTTDTIFDPNHFYGVPGQYTVTLLATDSLGCTSTYTQIITVIWEYALHVPTAFTPNGDGLNEFFNVGHWNILEFNVQIFSRWGELLYQSDDKNFQWDGVYKGEPLPEGAYVWKITALAIGNVHHVRAGTVTLIR